MEKSEPTLIPEWLKNTGSQSSSSSSVSHLDANSTSKLSRNKTFVCNNDHDFGRSSGSDRTTSSYFRRSSSTNGSGHLRSYSSFGRNQRDKEWEKDVYDSRDRDKSVLGDRHHRGISDSPRNIVSGKYDRDAIRHSQSSISGKHNDIWTKKIMTDASSATGNNNNVLLTKGTLGGDTNKATFERNFPSLGVEERASIPEIGRIPSPGLSSAIQNLPIGTSNMIGGEKWTSALAEVPMSVGSNGIGISSVQQTTATPLALSTVTGLNMAEAIAHSPNHALYAPQSVGTQRLEELAIKQSRQLIPVTPSMPKNLSLSSSDKLKTKVGQLQHPSSSLPVNHSPGGSGKGDMYKSSNVGKLQVLNPVREKNGAASVVKDNLISLTGCSIPSSTLPAAPSVSASAAPKGSPKIPALDRKPVSTLLEKRSTSQSQSRKEFFNLVRKKSMSNSSSVADSALENSSAALDIGPAQSQPFSDQLIEMEVVPAPVTQIVDAQLSEDLSVDLLAETTEASTCIADACDAQNHFSNGNQHTSFDSQFSEEEEAAFLRSLGWEENADEDGLTEEEISAFFKDLSKYINSKPAFKILQGVQHKFISPCDSPVSGIGSGLSSSDAKLES